MEFEALLNFDKSYETEIEKHTAPVGEWIVEGYAATSDLDSQNHIISQDAINMGADCLIKYNTVLFNHDTDKPIGKLVGVEAQAGKLFIKVAISKSEPKIWEQIKDGTLSKFSIRGRITDSEVSRDSLTEKQILVIKGMELHEVSLVSVPANIHARSLSWYIEKSISDSKVSPFNITVKLDSEQLAKDLSELIEKKTHRMPGESMASCVARKTKINIKEGMKPKQAVAAAYSMCGETKKDCGCDKVEVKDIISELAKELKEDEVKEIVSELTKGGHDIVEKVEDTKPVVDEIKKDAEKPASDEKKEVVLDVGALKDVIAQLQSLAKEVNSQSEVVKAQADAAKASIDEINKAKDEITKMVSDLNTLVKDIPIRKGQHSEEEKADERKDGVNKNFTETDEYKHSKPSERLHKILSFAQGVK